MKTRRLLLAVLAVLLPLVTWAEEYKNVVIDGIYYDLTYVAGKVQDAVVVRPYSEYDFEWYAGYSGNIVIPSTVSYQGVDYSVTSIAYRAFFTNYSEFRIPSVTIPPSVTYIGDEAFAGEATERKLKSVHISDLTAWCKIKFGGRGANPLKYAHHLYLNGEEVKDLVIPDDVTSVGSYAFDGCSGLTSVTISNSVSSIGTSAFSGCSGLTSVTIPNSVTSIYGSAFYDCTGLTTTTIPNSVTSIGNYAFYGCSGLTSVTIPNSVTSVGDYAFSRCTGLTSIVIPNSMTSFGKDVLNGCIGLTSISLPDCVTSIENEAFKDFVNLTSINIPNSVTSIGEYAFCGCTGLSSVTIPNSVKSIGKVAFSGCSGMKSVSIGEKVNKVGTSAFSGCSGLNSVHISDVVAWSRIVFESDYHTNPLEYAHHLYMNGEEIKDLVIPYGVKSYDGSVKFDGSNFNDCTGLTSVTFPEGVTSVSGFGGCTGLTSVTFPNSVTSVSGFGGCTGLTSVTFPEGVTSVSGFGGTGLTSVTFPSSVTSVSGFSSCTGLTSVTFPNNVTTIGENAFKNCTQLARIQLGKSVATIEGYAFQGCSGLTDVICLAKSVPSTAIGVFSDSYINYTTLHVYASSIEAYKAKTPWRTFKSIVAADVPMYTLTYMVDGNVYKSVKYEEGEKITAEPEPTKDGYTFSGWSEIPEEMPAHDVTVTGTFIRIPLGKCASPTITFENGKLVFGCETEDVEYNYEVSANVSLKGKGNGIPVNPSITVTVYASRDDYDDSDVTTKDIQITASDSNGDGVVNAADIVSIVNAIMKAQ